jgi:hypothetical protein
MTKRFSQAVLLLLCVASGGVHASARIDALSVAPGAPMAGSAVSFNIVMNRVTPLDLAPCDLAIDPGDGSAPMTLRFGATDSKNRSALYTYPRPGTYKARVRGTGSSSCDGEKEIEVKVGGTGPAATAPAVAPPALVPVAAPAAAALGGCPDGWSVATQDGLKFSCRANPPARPISCGDGTKYFVENGQIGCR